VVHAHEISGDLLVTGLDRVLDVGVVHGDAFVGEGNASVSFGAVHGDLGAEHQHGPVSVKEAHGDLHLKHVAVVRAGTLHGDLYARDVAAEIEIGLARGDVQLRDVAGAASLEEVQGDLGGQDLSGGLTAHQVQGSVSLKTGLTPGCTYSARAQGDVSARFPPEASARFTLSAQGDVSVKGFDIEEQASGEYVGQVGEGEAEVSLETEGSLRVKVRGAGDERQPWGFSLETLGAEIEAEIAAHMGELDHAKIASREVEKVMRQVEREMARAQEQAQKAMERAQERARRAEGRAKEAQEKALQRAKQFQAKVDLDWHSRGHRRPGSRGAPSHGRASSHSRRSAPRGPSGEEQAAVLRMLQENKISVEEAEELLKALGS
jgi:hypothetical protein